MSCKPTYKGVRYNSLEELYRANGVNEQQKQQAQQLYSEYLEQGGSKQDIEGFKNFIKKLGLQTNQDDFDITELMEENRDLKLLMDYLIEEMIQADPNFLDSLEWADMKGSMDKILEFVGKKLSTEHEIYLALKAEFENYKNNCSI